MNIRFFFLSIILFLVTFLLPVAAAQESSFLSSASFEQTISSVDRYYNSLTSYVQKNTKGIRLQRIKTRMENKLWSTLLLGLQKAIKNLDGEKRIVYQTVWSKIIQRKEVTQFSTNDLVVQWEIINEVNRLRKERGLIGLTYNLTLTRAAYTHAQDMYLNFPYDTDGDGIKETISHAGTDGTRVQDRVELLGYNILFVGENIAYNQISAQQVTIDWTNSPTHYANLVTDKVTQIGIAKIGSYWVLVVGQERQNR